MRKLIKVGVAMTSALLALGTSGAAIGIASAATTDANSTLTAVPPTLNSEPSIDFGTSPVSLTTKTYTSTGITGSLDVANAGGIAGWTVTVSASPFTSADGGVLEGTTFELDNSSKTPIVGTCGQSAAELPTAVTPFALTSTPATIFSAPASTDKAHVGVGEFSDSFQAGDASLTIPAGSTVAGAYTSTLTWTLSDASTSATTPSA